MDANKKTPTELLAELLATMTARATEAERQRDEARKSEHEWYENWKVKQAELKAMENRLNAEIEEHRKTTQKLVDVTTARQYQQGE